MECKATYVLKRFVACGIRIVPEWNVKKLDTVEQTFANLIRIVPEWNVKLKTVAKYMNYSLIRIVPEWNVKYPISVGRHEFSKLESYQSGM